MSGVTMKVRLSPTKAGALLKKSWDLEEEVADLKDQLEFVRKAFPGAVQEAYESGFYEGAGGDAWHSDHDDEGNLTPDACVRKPLAEYMREVHEVDVTLTGEEDSDEG